MGHFCHSLKYFSSYFRVLPIILIYLTNNIRPLLSALDTAEIVQQVALFPLLIACRVEVIVINIHHVCKRKYALLAGSQVDA